MSERYVYRNFPTIEREGVYDRTDNQHLDASMCANRLNALTAERDALVAQNKTLVKALENLVRQFAEDGQEPSSEDVDFMIVFSQARTALAKAKGV